MLEFHNCYHECVYADKLNRGLIELINRGEQIRIPCLEVDTVDEKKPQVINLEYVKKKESLYMPERIQW